MRARARVPDFSSLRVAVAGDLIADRYLYASPRKLSREAPVIVLRHERETLGLGGAANVARNLRVLGAQAELFGLAGRDASGRELVALLGEEEIGHECVLSVPGWVTPTKTRVLAAEPRRSAQQVLRIDREPSGPAPAAKRAEIARRLRARGAGFDALVVSDYEYGLVGEELGALASEWAEAGRTVVLDPRRELEAFRGITALTPNVGELARFTGAEQGRLDDPAALARAARELLGESAVRWLLVTRGNLGMALFGEGLPAAGLFVEASGTGEVTDVSGAGDTSAAVFALALAAGEGAPEAMRLANAAAGVVVLEHGAAACTHAQLEQALGGRPASARTRSKAR
jgi:rfaE bifunctional protein kinase chain/domain